MNFLASDLVKETLLGIVRHALTTLAGILVAQGVITGDQTNDLIGAGLFVAGVAWSWWQKRGQQLALAAVKK